MVTAVDSPAKLCGVRQSLRLWVNVELVPSEKFTTNACEAWLPLTPVPTRRSDENWPAGNAIVFPVALTALAAFAAPRLNVAPPNVCDVPSRFEEYASPEASNPPVKVVPSATMPVRLKA